MRTVLTPTGCISPMHYSSPPPHPSSCYCCHQSPFQNSKSVTGMSEHTLRIFRGVDHGSSADVCQLSSQRLCQVTYRVTSRLSIQEVSSPSHNNSNSHNVENSLSLCLRFFILNIVIVHPSYSHLEKALATHSSTLAWKIPWREGPSRLQSMGSLRVGHNWENSLSLLTFMHWRRKRQPTPVFLPGESQGWQSLVGCRLWGRTESDTTDVI